MNFTAILVDVVNIDSVFEDYIEETNLYIKAVINYLNRIFKKSIKAKIEIINESSLQGVLTNPVAAYLYYRQLELLLYPIKLKCGIGVGQIYYEESPNSTEMAGPAYFNARTALDLSNEKDYNSLCFISFSNVDKYINAMLSASHFIEKRSSITINLIKLMGELFFPLYKKDSMDFIEFKKNDDFKKALQYKEEFYKIINTLDKYNIKGAYPDASNFNLPLLSDCEIIDFEILYNLKHEEIINCFWKRGYSTKISLAMNNTSRQNVDKHLEGGIIEQRNLDGAICLLLNEIGNNILKR